MTDPAIDVISLGEAMIELALPGPPPGPAQVSFAGDTFNTAVYLKRSAPELRVAYATKMGRDRFSDGFLAMMEEEHLDPRLVRRSDSRLPGIYAISTDPEGERSFSYWRERSAARAMFAPPGLRADDLACRYLYVSAITMAILPAEDRAMLLDWLPDFRAGGGRVVFDSNYRPALWSSKDEARDVIERAWQETDIALPSLEDEMALFGDADAEATMDRLHGYGIGCGALKRGAEGPLPVDGSEAGPFARVETVIDSTAAGDSFNAAYLATLIWGGTQAEALEAGHALACKVIGVRGAIVPKEADGGQC